MESAKKCAELSSIADKCEEVSVCIINCTNGVVGGKEKWGRNE